MFTMLPVRVLPSTLLLLLLEVPYPVEAYLREPSAVSVDVDLASLSRRALSAPPPTMSAPQFVTLDTSVGSFTVELYTTHAPKVGVLRASCFELRAPSCSARMTPAHSHLQTCNNFAKLAERGYYNGVIFHRIIPVRRYVVVDDDRRRCHVCRCRRRISFLAVSRHLCLFYMVP
jgi:hypothetical protein